jgi:hypothetical protein
LPNVFIDEAGAAAAGEVAAGSDWAGFSGVGWTGLVVDEDEDAVD